MYCYLEFIGKYWGGYWIFGETICPTTKLAIKSQLKPTYLDLLSVFMRARCLAKEYKFFHIILAEKSSWFIFIYWYSIWNSVCRL